MKVALVDNGSLEPAAHESLRWAAAAIAKKAETPVEAVSWKHSDRIPPGTLGGAPAWTLAPWLRARVAEGEREFVFVPFFISPQGAIGSLLRGDIEKLREETGGFEYTFTRGLDADPTLAAIVVDRLLDAAAEKGLRRPPVVVVDHGGPSAASSAVRDRVTDAVRLRLNGALGVVAAASMESPGTPGADFSRPLLADALAASGFDSGDVLIAPLFLSPGRHAGPAGDLARIARAAEARSPALRCHFAGLVGSHAAAIECLSFGLLQALSIGAPP